MLFRSLQLRELVQEVRLGQLLSGRRGKDLLEPLDLGRIDLLVRHGRQHQQTPQGALELVLRKLRAHGISPPAKERLPRSEAIHDPNGWYQATVSKTTGDRYCLAFGRQCFSISSL